MFRSGRTIREVPIQMPAVPLLTYYTRYRRRMVERADGERRRRRVRGARSGQATPTAAPATEPGATARTATAPDGQRGTEPTSIRCP